MRVKMFAINEAGLKRRGFRFGEAPVAELASELEDSVNEWLEGNPGIRVVRTEQFFRTRWNLGPVVWVSVWYEDA